MDGSHTRPFSSRGRMIGCRAPMPGTHDLAAIASLTERELEVLKLVAGGLSNAEIAQWLVVSEATVTTHVTSLVLRGAPSARQSRTSPVPGLGGLNDYVLAASFVINRPGDAELRNVSATGSQHPSETLPSELHSLDAYDRLVSPCSPRQNRQQPI